MNVLRKTANAVTSLLSPRAGLLKQWADLQARHDREGTAEAQALEADRLAYEAWREPQLRYERRQAEAFAASCRRDRGRAELERALRARPSPAQLELEKFLARVEREVREPVRLIEHVNRLTDERTVSSDDGGARGRAADVLINARRELRDRLPFLSDEEITVATRRMKLAVLTELDGGDVAELGDVAAEA